MDQISDVMYRTTATSTDGGGDRVSTDDGVLDLPVKAPEELGGPGGATNPEQLFAASFATCFHSALVLAASELGVDTDGSTVRATARIGRDDKGYVWAVDVVAELPKAEEATRRRAFELAEDICPIVRATRGNIEVDVSAG